MKGKIGTPMVNQTTERRTCKAKKLTWCKRCRHDIYPGEWIYTGRINAHRYDCPDPAQASEAYLKRLSAQVSKKKLKKVIG